MNWYKTMTNLTTPLSCFPNLKRNNGKTVIENSSVTAIINAQIAFKGASKNFGVNFDRIIAVKTANGNYM